MVRLLRRRPRPDDLATQQRKTTNARGRRIYLLLLGVFALALLNFAAGDFVFLHADGLVLRDRNLIDAAYVARVEEVRVREGDAVEAGEPLLVVQSMEILQQLGDLSARLADVAGRESDYRIRAETVAELLPLAVQREAATSEVVARLDAQADQRLFTQTRYDDALRERFDASETAVELEAQDRVLREGLEVVEAARQDAERAVEDLRTRYAGGTIAAPVSGAIGAEVPSRGEVFLPGETMLSVYAGEPYVLAYLPRRYLFPIAVGMEVTVESGRLSAIGEIVAILPVTDTLPEEFQNAFRPADRSQLARIAFREPPPFPLHDKVTISHSWLRSLFSSRAVAAPAGDDAIDPITAYLASHAE